jgi:hypothetical protein
MEINTNNSDTTPASGGLNKAKIILLFFVLFFGASVILFEIRKIYFVTLRSSDQTQVDLICVLVLVPIFLGILYFLFRFKKILLKDVRIYFLLAFLMFFPFVFVQSSFLFLNALLDNSDSVIHDIRVSYKKPYTGGKRFGYFIEALSWVDGEGLLTINVPYDLYASIDIGDQIELVTKRGKFGIEWIREYKKINP